LFILSLQKIRDGAKQFLPGSKGVAGEREGMGGGRGQGVGGRNDPNIVYTYE
jgi:hypothetical protein